MYITCKGAMAGPGAYVSSLITNDIIDIVYDLIEKSIIPEWDSLPRRTSSPAFSNFNIPLQIGQFDNVVYMYYNAP